MTRREFLTTAWAAVVTMIAAVAGGIGLWHGAPPEQASGRTVFELSPPPAAPVEIPGGKFAWMQGEKGAAAISEVCPHMGCVLSWQAQEGQFQCPCHGSRFDAAGHVVHGPAEHALNYLQVTVLDEAGQVVDVTTPEHLWVRVGTKYRYRIDAGNPISPKDASAA